MTKRNTKTTDQNSLYGLSVSGTVIDRTRRMVPQDNPTTEIVTYTIQDGFNRKHYVDDYAPSDYYDIDSCVYLPVYIKTYRKWNGDPSYTLNIQKPDVSRGECF